MSTDNSTRSKQLTRRYIASELNLSRLPFFASDTKNLSQKDAITYQDTATYEGKEIELVWEVTSNAKYGYPGPFAESVHAALLDIITERGLPFENPVVFSFYDLCDRLDIQLNGKNVRNIRNAILSIRLAGIVIENSFVTKEGRRISHTPDPTFLYKRVALYGDTNQETGETMDVSAVWLSDFYLRSLNSGNVRPIDFEYFKHLHSRSFAATKIYQYIGYRFAGAFKHDNDYARVDYDDLAVIADVKRRQYLSQAKQKLQKAHEALMDTGFVSHIEWVAESQYDGPKKFYIHYYPGDRAQEEYQDGRLKLDQQLEIPLLPNQWRKEGDPRERIQAAINESESKKRTTTPMAHELEALGVTHDRSVELDQEYSEERITRQLDHLDYLSERGKSPDDAAAWLVSAIEKDFTTPEGFKTREERKAEERARAKAQERKRRKEQEEKRKQKEEEARRERLDERLAALSNDRQEAIEETITERIRKSNQNLVRTVYKGDQIDPKGLPFRAQYYDYLEELLEEHEES